MNNLPAFSVEGKVVLVTGGATGIGTGISKVLAAAGADSGETSHRFRFKLTTCENASHLTTQLQMT